MVVDDIVGYIFWSDSSHKSVSGWTEYVIVMEDLESVFEIDILFPMPFQEIQLIRPKSEDRDSARSS